jgi:FtsH-binding integral membrane protein
METSLFFKTFMVFGSQLSIVFGFCYLFIYSIRKATLEGRPFLGANFAIKYNAAGEIDLFSPEQESYDKWRRKVDAELESFRLKVHDGTPYKDENRKAYKDKKRKAELLIAKKEKEMSNSLNTMMGTLCFVWIFFFVGSTFISFTDYSIGIKMTSLTVASLTFGPLLGVIMIQMDENDGLRILKLTVAITFLAALIGIYSGLDFSWLGFVLIIPLFLLVTWNFLNIFYNFSGWLKRSMGFFGSVIFTLYLLYDFNRLERAAENGVNNWNTAFEIGFSIYLNVLNLLLELLEAMG